jgi:hypothetical protein
MSGVESVVTEPGAGSTQEICGAAGGVGVTVGVGAGVGVAAAGAACSDTAEDRAGTVAALATRAATTRGTATDRMGGGADHTLTGVYV